MLGFRLPHTYALFSISVWKGVRLKRRNGLWFTSQGRLEPRPVQIQSSVFVFAFAFKDLWARKKAQSIEDPSSTLRMHVKQPGVVACLCNPNEGRDGDRRISEPCWPASLVKLVSSRFDVRLVLNNKKIMGRVIKEDPTLNSGLHMHAHTYTFALA